MILVIVTLKIKLLTCKCGGFIFRLRNLSFQVRYCMMNGLPGTYEDVCQITNSRVCALCRARKLSSMLFSPNGPG